MHQLKKVGSGVCWYEIKAIKEPVISLIEKSQAGFLGQMWVASFNFKIKINLLIRSDY